MDKFYDKLRIIIYYLIALFLVGSLLLAAIELLAAPWIVAINYLFNTDFMTFISCE